MTDLEALIAEANYWLAEPDAANELSLRAQMDDATMLIARLRDALAVLDRLAAPGWRPTHRHVKRGTDYQVIAFGAIQAADPVADETEVTIYLAGNGAYYVRPTAEFNDGRFLAIKPDPSTDEAAQ